LTGPFLDGGGLAAGQVLSVLQIGDWLIMRRRLCAGGSWSRSAGRHQPGRRLGWARLRS
jgi:hypothetical protein